MSSPWLHVLIPVYGRPGLLTETLDSVRGLAAAGISVTVVDDASPDGDVEDLVASYPGVDYRRNDVNLGVAGNFNHCAELSTGDYTLLLGSDDLLLSSYADVVHRLVNSFERPAMVMPSVRVVDAHGLPARPLADRAKGWVAPHGPERLLSGEPLARSLLLGNWLYFPAIAWRTDLLAAFPFRPEQRSAMDLDMELRLVFAGHGVAWSPEVAACYRRHARSVSATEATQGARFAEERAISRWAAEQSSANGWTSAARVARLRPLSRLHAVSVAIPQTLRSPVAARPFWAHALGR